MARIAKFFLLLIISAEFMFGCATAYDRKGVYYKVRKGETISKIAKYHGVSVESVVKYNNIQSPEDVTEGLKLYIPSEKGEKIAKKSRFSRKQKIKSEKDDNFLLDDGKFIWPVEGVLFSNFGIRKGRRHDGIDISADPGTPIKAAAKGRVVFQGRMRGYGNMIILKHGNKFFTVYAHNQSNSVSEGQKINKGEVIAYLGSTGRTTGPHLHFEVREGQTARNPIQFLPAVEDSNVKLAKKSSSRSSKSRKKIIAKKSKAKVQDKKQVTLSKRKEINDNVKSKKSKK